MSSYSPKLLMRSIQPEPNWLAAVETGRRLSGGVKAIARPLTSLTLATMGRLAHLSGYDTQVERHSGLV